LRLTEQLAAEQAALSDAYATLRTTNEQLEFLARHDPLTGLLNRRGALDALDHLLAAADRPVGVLFIDLDRFKAVNDLLAPLGFSIHGESWRSQASSADDSSIPDLVAEVGGRQKLIIEAKFWASLTENQPLGYLDRQSRQFGADEDRLLVFLAPTRRRHLLTAELEQRMGVRHRDSGLRSRARAESLSLPVRPITLPVARGRGGLRVRVVPGVRLSESPEGGASVAASAVRET
jgi:hypothetical protein